VFFPTVTIDAPDAHPADLPIYEGDLTGAARLTPGTYPATADYADLFAADDPAREEATSRGTVTVTADGAAFFDPTV
jgi:hypothetical protein